MRVGRMLTMFAAAALIGGACSDNNTTGIPAGLEVFTATLNGASERPDPTTTPATGKAVITVMEKSSQLEDRGHEHQQRLRWTHSLRRG